MNIECPNCSASYNIDPSRIPADGMSMRCPKCSHSFKVGSGGDIVGGGTLLGGVAKSERLFVKRNTGKVFGPFDPNAIEMMIKSDKLGADAEVSADKSNWSSIVTYPAFAELLNKDPLPTFDGDPKATQMGGWREAQDLPISKAAGSTPKLPGLPKPPPLPGANLPAPAGNNLPGLSANLPKAKSGGLPSLPNLPGSIGNLPGPSLGAGLPQSASGLPQSAPGLPQSAAGLPASASGLPVSAAGLPASAAALPASAAALPGAIAHDLPAMPRTAGAPGGTLGPGLPAIEGDLFGGGDSDDLFGASEGLEQQSDVDLFGAPKDEEDIFGQPSAAEEHQDLFTSPEDEESDLFVGNAAGNDDFLTGDAGFSFLDDQSAGKSATAAPSDAWGDDLFAERSEVASEAHIGPESEPIDDWGDDLLSGGSSNVSHADDDPFRPKSRGIEVEAAPIPEQAGVSKEQAVDADKKRGSLGLLMIPVVLLVLGALGYFIYTNFIQNTDITNPQVKPTKTVVTVSADSITNDTYDTFALVVDPAVTGTIPPEKVGELLFVESLMLTRYENEKASQQASKLFAQLKDPKTDYEKLGKGAYEAQSGNADAARAYLEPISGADGEIGYFSNALMGIADVISIEKEVEKRGENLAAKNDAETIANSTNNTTNNSTNNTSEQNTNQEVAATNNTAEQTNNAAEESDATDRYQSRVARAKQSFENAEKIVKGPLPYYWNGRLHLLFGEREDARKAFESAVKVAENHVASRIELGKTFYADGNLNDAIKQFERVNGDGSKFASKSELSESLHQAGLVHVGRNQSQLAIDAFVKALSFDSGRSSTLRALAEEYERAKKFKEALNFFTTNKNLGQNDPEVMLGIVRSHIGLEQWNEAITRLEEGQKQFPQDARFPVNLGQLFMKRGAYFDAQKPLERAVEIDPTLLTAHATLAKLAYRNKDLEKGEEHIAEIVKQPTLIDAKVAGQVADYYHVSNRRDTAYAWYREALKHDPNHWPSRLALARLLLEEKKYDDARQLLEKARSEGVEDVRLSAYLADAYRQSGEFDRAIDEVNKVIEAFPNNEEYLFILGRIEFDRGNYETARDQFNRAYEINPQYHEAYFYVGRSSFEKGEYEVALELFRHVLDRKPDRGEYRFFMARALEKANRTSQALDEYRKATAVDKAYGVENPMVYVYRGQLLNRLGYTREGKADIAKALELSPENTDALVAMANTEFDEKNYADAITHYGKALEADPARPDAQYRLGMANLYADKSRKAAEHLQLAVKHGYKNPEVYKNLGYVYKSLGQRALAKESFGRFLEVTKETRIPAATKREVLEQIKKL